MYFIELIERFLWQNGIESLGLGYFEIIHKNY